MLDNSPDVEMLALHIQQILTFYLIGCYSCRLTICTGFGSEATLWSVNYQTKNKLMNFGQGGSAGNSCLN